MYTLKPSRFVATASAFAAALWASMDRWAREIDDMLALRGGLAPCVTCRRLRQTYEVPAFFRMSRLGQGRVAVSQRPLQAASTYG